MAQDARLQDLLRRAAVTWVPLAALDGPRELSCIDGRHEHGVVGAPGGDTGELLLLLAAAESMGSAPLATADVEALVDDVLDRYGAFYVHTDRAALTRLGDALQRDEALPCAAEDLDDVEAFVRQPPNRCRVPLLRHLTRAEHIGCGHLRCVTGAPDEYDVRSGLIQDLLRAVFTRLWDGHPGVRFVVVEGVNQEVAVLVLEAAEDDPEAAASVPVLDTPPGMFTVFTLHRPAAEHVRDVGVRWLVDALGRLHPGERPDAEALRRRVDDLSARHLAATLSRLAPELPRWVVRYDARTRTLEPA